MWDTLGSDSEAGFCYLPSHSTRPRSASLGGGAAVGIGAWWCAIWRGKNPPFSQSFRPFLSFLVRRLCLIRHWNGRPTDDSS